MLLLLPPALLLAALTPMAPYRAGIAEFAEAAAVNAANAVEAAPITLPQSFAASAVQATFHRTTVSPSAAAAPPVVLLHSFDSSCLEFRRVMPLLEEAQLEAYSLDLLGWGFVETKGNVQSVSVEAKRAYLLAFWEQVLEKRPAVFVGSSLGAAAIIGNSPRAAAQILPTQILPRLDSSPCLLPPLLSRLARCHHSSCCARALSTRVCTDLAAAHPQTLHATVLLDPQGFIEGTPPVPAAFARGGVELLRSWPLRSLGQLIAYEDVPRCATDDAIRIGRLHCSREGWDDDAIDWLLGGGYSVASRVPSLDTAPCTILWGRQDRVLPPPANVPQFVEALPHATYRWVESCGRMHAAWLERGTGSPPHPETPCHSSCACVF